MANQIYRVRAKLWRFQGKTGWHFLTLPKRQSEEIKTIFNDFKKSFGSIPVQVTIGKTTFKTSIFPDSKAGAYLLPIKALVRKRERISDGDTVHFELQVAV